jgi:hypothetical protein
LLGAQKLNKDAQRRNFLGIEARVNAGEDDFTFFAREGEAGLDGEKVAVAMEFRGEELVWEWRRDSPYVLVGISYLGFS